MAVGRQAGGDFDPSAPVSSFLNTALRVVTQPTSFFAELPRRGNLANPLIFALICLVMNAIFAGIVELARVEVGQLVRIAEEPNPLEKVVGFVANLALTPMLGGIGVFIGAGFLQMLTRLIVGVNNSGYRATFRVVSYATVTTLVSWIPVVGGFLALYGLYLYFVGIREMHQATTGEAGLIVLIVMGVIALGLLAFIVALVVS